MTDTQIPSRYVEHSIELAAPPSAAFDVVADVTRWPLIFSPCVHAEVLDSGPGRDRIRLWALTGEAVRSWVSQRALDATAFRVAFEQENSKPPLASMGGHWRVEADRLVLAHHWATVDSTPENEAWVAEVLDRNSDAETAAVKEWAEHGDRTSELAFSFRDDMVIPAPAAAVYDFLHRSDLWPDRLPHVASLTLDTEPASELTGDAEVQTMAMETAGQDGSTHTTQSIRLCWPDERIVYKQTLVPRGLRAHSGEWLLVPDAGGVRVVATHRVALDAARVEDVFGAGTTLAQAQTRVRDLLRGNSLATLEHARTFLA